MIIADRSVQAFFALTRGSPPRGPELKPGHDGGGTSGPRAALQQPRRARPPSATKFRPLMTGRAGQPAFIRVAEPLAVARAGWRARRASPSVPKLDDNTDFDMRKQLYLIYRPTGVRCFMLAARQTVALTTNVDIGGPAVNATRLHPPWPWRQTSFVAMPAYRAIS